MNKNLQSAENRNDPITWLLEEYKLLSSHYFHEDSLFWKGMGYYSTVNGGLLVFLGSDFLRKETVVQYIIPIIGIVLCVSWISSLIRIREYRDYIVHRIKKIEIALHSEWDDVSLLPADIRSFIDWEELGNKGLLSNRLYRFFRNFPSSLSLLLLPVSFLISWFVILILKIY
jgi:hypothetical protein